MKQLTLFVTEKKKKPIKMDDKFVLENILNDLPYPVYSEYRFTYKRKFRFDYFISLDNNKGLAIEYEGGVYTNGRHVRPIGFINDCYKYNMAVSMGIPVLRYTCRHLEAPETVKAEILRAIKIFSPLKIS
jgi:hypothetical protein